MKSVTSIVSVLALAFLLSTTALAKSKDSGSFDLTQPAKIGSTELAPGHYKADWKPLSGNKVAVDIEQHGKTVITAQAHVKELPKAAADNAVTLKPVQKNNQKVVEIDFSGHTQALVFGS